MINATQATVGQSAEQLKLLMDYTLFHIGLYTTLVTGLIAVSQYVGTSSPGLVKIATCFFLIAGMAGGVIASNIPEFKDWKTFSTAMLGPWNGHWWTYTYWARIEHTTFWLGVAFGASAYLFSKPRTAAGFTP